ncbi:hypothetical protein FKP32DRAFT_1615937 [Trametes sanguinea]|nr:hypothetical protein FKP32DRAFT_1615937 [Trametes sanguinea]
MTSRPTTPNIVAAIRKRMGRELTRDEMLRLARAMRIRQAQQRIYKPRMELWDDGKSATVTAVFELPGLRPDQVLLDVVDGRLVVSGERRQRGPMRLLSSGGSTGEPDSSAERMPGAVRVGELKYGTFRRVIPVPDGCMTKDLHAILDNGMLTVSWPRHPQGVNPEPLLDNVHDTPAGAVTPPRFGGAEGSRSSY